MHASYKIIQGLCFNGNGYSLVRRTVDPLCVDMHHVLSRKIFVLIN